MSKFTPGPWIVGYNGGKTGPTTPNNVGPCCGGREYPYEIVGIGKATLAIIPKQEGQHSLYGVDGNYIANAHLIAAAPDMYEALSKVSEAIQANLLDQYAAMCEIEKVLAKARVETEERK